MTASVAGMRVGVDDRGDRVGGVVEAVDELEAERDQQRDAEQDPRHRDGAGQVLAERVADIDQAADDDRPEQRHEPFAEQTWPVERMLRPWNSYFARNNIDHLVTLAVCDPDGITLWRQDEARMTTAR